MKECLELTRYSLCPPSASCVSGRVLMLTGRQVHGEKEEKR